MIIYLVLLAVLCLWRAKFTDFREDYLSKNQTDALKGVFGLMIFLSHVRSHIPLIGTADLLYSAIFTRLGQMAVVPFLFYSGYSIIYNIQNRPRYMEGFFRKRIVKLLLEYNLVVITYAVYNFSRGVVFPLENYLLAWCGWKSLTGFGLGGSWYIFVILMLYVATFVAYWYVQRIFTKSSSDNLLPLFTAVFLFSIGLVITLNLLGKEEYWYNTVMSYSSGMLYGIYKPKIDYVMRNKWAYVTAICGICTGAATILLSGRKDVVCYSLMSVFFVLFVTLITMHVTVENPVLSWIGKISFGLYILQRAFMRIYSSWGLGCYPEFFTALCLASTIMAAIIHRRIADEISKSHRINKKEKV